MAAGEDGDQELVDDLVLADDLAGDLLADLAGAPPRSSFQLGQVGLGGVRGRRGALKGLEVLKVRSSLALGQRWKTGRYLKGSWRMMTAIDVP